MINDLIILLGIALLDSLNPASIGTHLMLLANLRDSRKALAFVASTFATYLLAGLVLYLGFSIVLMGAIEAFRQYLGDGLYALEMSLGVLLISLGLIRLSRPKGERPKADRLLDFFQSFAGIIVLGITSTMADLPTAVPYLGWIALIQERSYTPLIILLFFIIYNILYILPLILVQLLYLRNKQQIAAWADKVQHWVIKLSRWVIIIGSLSLGIMLCYDALMSWVH